MRYSYEIKARILGQHIDRKQRTLSRSIFENGINILDSLDLQKQFDEIHGIDAWKISYSLNHSRYKRKERIQKRIADMVMSGSASFLTLTFTDEVFNSTNEETRRRYVRRWLKSFCSQYVANIDYGEDFGREHYHAVIDRLDVPEKWTYGFSSAKKIRSNGISLEKISKYITKLTNHAIKKSAELKRIIYSRL